jgi:PD-(D/E)XK nuclease superfamily
VALQHHKDHGDGDCPVCGRTAALTAQWRQATEQELARLGRAAQAAARAEQAAADSARLAASLMQSPPTVLAEAPPPGTDVKLALTAWKNWAKAPAAGTSTNSAGLRALADHLDQALAPLTREIRDLSARTSAELVDRDDRWAPVAAEVASWCADAEAALDAVAPVAAIKAADRWLKAATDDIRNDRLAPLADKARTIWALLRQESNVDLGAIRLAGSATQRHVKMDVSVDGAAGSALGIMSQGEVNALALSVFLPVGQWAARLERLAARTEQVSVDEGESWPAERAADARALARFVTDAAQRVDEIAAAGTWADAAALLRMVLDHYLGGATAAASWGIPQDALEDPEVRAQSDVERDAYEEALAVIDELASLDDIAVPVSADTLLDVLGQELTVQVREATGLGRGVLVGPLWDLAGADLDLLIIVGAAEGSYPPRGREHPLLRDEVRAGIGLRLQLPLYALAAGQAYGGSAGPPSAYYWFVDEGGTRRGGRVGPSAVSRLHEVLDVLAGGIRDGAFPARPGEYNPWYRSFGNCSWCQFDRVCSRTRDDLWDRVRADPRVSRYAGLAEPAENGLVTAGLLDQAARDRIVGAHDANLFVDAGAGSGKIKQLGVVRGRPGRHAAVFGRGQVG